MRSVRSSSRACRATAAPLATVRAPVCKLEEFEIFDVHRRLVTSTLRYMGFFWELRNKIGFLGRYQSRKNNLH